MQRSLELINAMTCYKSLVVNKENNYVFFFFLLFSAFESLLDFFSLKTASRRGLAKRELIVSKD